MRQPDEPSRFFYGLSRWLLWVALRFKLPIKVFGVENVPVQGGVLIASNHASYLDPPLIGCPIKSRPVRFMARDTLFKNRFMSWFYQRVGVVPLSREKGDIGAMKTAIQLMKSGHCVALFPEGTRTGNGELQKAKSGIGFLIHKAGVPVVPTYIGGSFHAFPRGASKINRHPVTISYGKVISTDELMICKTDGKPDFDAITQLVMSRIESLKPAK